MATLNQLKWALRRAAESKGGSTQQPLTETDYCVAFDVFVHGVGWTNYEKFIIPKLSQLMAPLLLYKSKISVLEIGPGPKSILGSLPRALRGSIRKYTALEPNSLFANQLGKWLRSGSGNDTSPFSRNCLAEVHQACFDPATDPGGIPGIRRLVGAEPYDIVLFCHSLYGMKPARRYVKTALEMLPERSNLGLVVVFHRYGTLDLGDLVCYKTACFPDGKIVVAAEGKKLYQFASFIAGFKIGDVSGGEQLSAEWQAICRRLGRHKISGHETYEFTSPEVMISFSQNALAIPSLLNQVPTCRNRKIKNRQAQSYKPASIVRPENIQQVQACVEWALENGTSLSVIGGAHSGQCLWSHVVALDMSAFKELHVFDSMDGCESTHSSSSKFIVAGAGCSTGEIIQEAVKNDLLIPLGARPSVGIGLWLQGGIGHSTRLHGLACDSIVGAVIVSVQSGQIFCTGFVPESHWPTGGIRPSNDADLLWATRGAATGMGIFISIIFKTHPASLYCVENWIAPIDDESQAYARLREIDFLCTKELPRHCSLDAYLHWDRNQLSIGITAVEACHSATPTGRYNLAAWIPNGGSKCIDNIELFETEFYVSQMHGGHAGGKTSSFKRCVFLKNIERIEVINRLIEVMKTCPSPLCYLHLLHGGGALKDIKSSSTAFGCRDWNFACVITGVWNRADGDTEAAQSAIQWVYHVVERLIPLSSGIYGADLGPDPRDAMLASRAFGRNRPRLTSIKQQMDPRDILAFTCPIPKASLLPKLIVLVTGEICVGKDYCANLWSSEVVEHVQDYLTASVVRISDQAKREYSNNTGADFDRLIHDRCYKEKHRPALTKFFRHQVQSEPDLAERHFLDAIYGAEGINMLIITGMRDESPVSRLSHLVPDSRLIEVYIQAREETLQQRRGVFGIRSINNKVQHRDDAKTPSHVPTMVFQNDEDGDGSARAFARKFLSPFFDTDLRRLASMVRTIPEFPNPGIEFRHVLGICEHLGGLALCTDLLRRNFTGDWRKIDAIACSEAGGFLFAPALALQVDLPLVLIRRSGKLPPPTLSSSRQISHISSLLADRIKPERIEVAQSELQQHKSVVVVDDVLSTGQTLLAVLGLLKKAGIKTKDMKVIVVAEFPIHCGRELLRRNGFGSIPIQSLLIFGNS